MKEEKQKLKNKTMCLGDCHGGYKALQQCIERSNIDKDNDTLIVLGDVCDGWSQVAECYEELLTFKNLIYIIGNHDQWMLDNILKGNEAYMSEYWLKQGGRATLESYKGKEDLLKKHYMFLKEKGLYKYKDDQNNIFVHGGFDRHDYLINGSSNVFMWDRDLWNQALSCKTGVKLNFKDKVNYVFIGHTSTMFWGKDTPMASGGVVNLDTGAGWDGKLTIMNIDTSEFWQSDNVLTLYPNERGRK